MMQVQNDAARGRIPSVHLPLLLILLATLLTFGGGPARAASRSGHWGADYFPNVTLVNQDGKTLRFYDDVIKDKVVSINFIFTSCQDACPAETAKLRQVQQELGDSVGRDVFMYSISIDPEYDTPAVLKAYTQKFGIGPGWQFLTGRLEDITLLQKKLGLLRAELPEEDLDDHNVSLIVGNETSGQWMKRSPFENSKILAGLLGNSLHNHHGRKVAKRSYDSARQLADLQPGEQLFRTRCSSCHSMDTTDGMGPGLAGVTGRRERAWLERWLKEPDKMLAEKDPIALELFRQYHELPMPNLGLNDIDVAALLEYMGSVPRLETPGARRNHSGHDQ